jgi:hypothetical protein
MHRRSFLLSLASAASAVSIGALGRAATRAGSGARATDELRARLTADNDALVPDLLRRQQPAGAVVDAHGIPNAHETARLITVLASVRHAAGSRYRGDAALLDPLERAAAHLLTAQHDDGTIDLIATNFHSPPDTAFVIEYLGPVAAVLRSAADPAEQRLRDRLDTFLRRAGEALVTGGVHTPNHRWVVCAALAHLHHLFPDPRYVARVDQWLAEGIDLDPDGQFTEKSTTVYSPVVDRALLTVARLLDRPELREPVRRNLEMTLYYVHPDGEVVTEASKRQDKYQRGSMARYYYSYRTLARLDGNGRFAAMARRIEHTAADQLTRELLTFLEEAEFGADLPGDEPLPEDYARVFAHSHLARIRRGRVSGTVLARNPTLFSFRKGAAALEAVRLASAFFGKGQFSGEELVVRDGSYRLEQKLEGPYFQPLSAGQIAGGEHVRMAPNGTLSADGRAARARSNVQHLVARANVTEEAGRFRIEFELTGTAGVPVAIELAFRHGGRLEGVAPVAGIADAYLLPAGTGRYTAGDDTIAFGPGRADHGWTQLRGALPKWDGQSVYLTGLTPFRLNLEIS